MQLPFIALAGQPMLQLVLLFLVVPAMRALLGLPRAHIDAVCLPAMEGERVDGVRAAAAGVPRLGLRGDVAHLGKEGLAGEWRS